MVSILMKEMLYKEKTATGFTRIDCRVLVPPMTIFSAAVSPRAIL